MTQTKIKKLLTSKKSKERLKATKEINKSLITDLPNNLLLVLKKVKRPKNLAN